MALLWEETNRDEFENQNWTSISQKFTSAVPAVVGKSVSSFSMDFKLTGWSPSGTITAHVWHDYSGPTEPDYTGQSRDATILTSNWQTLTWTLPDVTITANDKIGVTFSVSPANQAQFGRADLFETSQNNYVGSGEAVGWISKTPTLTQSIYGGTASTGGVLLPPPMEVFRV